MTLFGWCGSPVPALGFRRTFFLLGIENNRERRARFKFLTYVTLQPNVLSLKLAAFKSNSIHTVFRLLQFILNLISIIEDSQSSDCKSVNVKCCVMRRKILTGISFGTIFASDCS